MNSTIRSAMAFGIAGALNAGPALASGLVFASARATARPTTMDETIYRPDCRSDEDYGSRYSCAINGLAGHP
jgi:hypothetical protein